MEKLVLVIILLEDFSRKVRSIVSRVENLYMISSGAEILAELIDLIRKISEECDLVHGFQFLHSIGGGTGGGFGSLIMDHVREDYSDRMIKSYSIFPALSMSQVIVG